MVRAAARRAEALRLPGLAIVMYPLAWGQVSPLAGWEESPAGAVMTQQRVTPAGVSALMPGGVSGVVFDAIGRVRA